MLPEETGMARCNAWDLAKNATEPLEERLAVVHQPWNNKGLCKLVYRFL